MFLNFTYSAAFFFLNILVLRFIQIYVNNCIHFHAVTSCVSPTLRCTCLSAVQHLWRWTVICSLWYLMVSVLLAGSGCRCHSSPIQCTQTWLFIVSSLLRSSALLILTWVEFHWSWKSLQKYHTMTWLWNKKCLYILSMQKGLRTGSMIYDKICLNKSKRDFEITLNLRILSVRKHCVLDNWQPLS